MVDIRTSLALSLGLLSTSVAVFGQTAPRVPATPPVANAVVAPGNGGPTLGGNLVLNGDFESYAGGNCDNNLLNASFTAMMADATGFGRAEEIDVYENPPCYGLSAFSGVRKIGLHTQPLNGLSDALSLRLAAPVVAGREYTLRFAAEAELVFDLGSVLVGISDDPAGFGTLVYRADLSFAGTWQSFSTTFVAPAGGTHLTVRTGDEQTWNHVDAFSLVESGVGTKYCTANDNSTGAPADLGASGSNSATVGDLALTSAPVPNQNGIFFHGANQVQLPFGNGFLCASGNIVRGAVTMGTGNVAAYTYNNSDVEHSLGAFVGTTRNFQHWFRDPVGGGAQFNTSNALSIAILP